MRRTRTFSSAVLLAVPAALVVYLAFQGGGFFPTAPATVAIGLAVVLVARLFLADEPLAGLSAGVGLAAAALGTFAAWTLLSGQWGTPARALLEYDRVLAYLLALVAFGTVARTPARLAWAVRLLAAAIVVVAGAGLVTWLLPEFWSVDPGAARDRLSYPLTYWNALGLLCAVGVVLALHLTTSGREPPAVRVISAGVVPILGVALFLTFSRGALAAGAVGVVVLLVAARPTLLVPGAIAALPASLVAVGWAYGAEELSGDAIGSAQALAEGREVAIVTAAACLGAAVLRALSLRADGWLLRRAEHRTSRGVRRLAAIAAVGLAVAAVAAVALDAPGAASRQYERFVEGDDTQGVDLRQRYGDPGNNGRLDAWRVALEGSRGERLQGVGAGSFATLWTQRRPNGASILDAHSLYVEVLAELGVVGLGLLVVALATLLGGFALRARGPDRGPPGALLGAGVAWALHAGIDWDWEMPAVTLWLFALGGLCLAAPADRLGTPWRPGRVTRVALAAGVVVLAITPVLVAQSQTRLDDAVRAFVADDCGEAIDRSLASLSALDTRPEPFELIGYCDVRLGEDDLAVRNLAQAVRRDPRNWELHYGLALVRGAVGRDPRPAAARAVELNPREPIALEARAQLDTDRRSEWRRRARALPLPGALR